MSNQFHNVNNYFYKVADYLAFNDEGAQGDLLSFWENNSKKWPKLSQEARNILSVPAASTSSDRAFSMGGLTINDQRTQLSGKKR